MRHNHKTLCQLLEYWVSHKNLSHIMVPYYIKMLNKFKTHNATVLRFYKNTKICPNTDGSITLEPEFSHEIVVPEFMSEGDVHELVCKWCGLEEFVDELDKVVKVRGGEFGSVVFTNRRVRRNFGVK